MATFTEIDNFIGIVAFFAVGACLAGTIVCEAVIFVAASFDAVRVAAHKRVVRIGAGAALGTGSAAEARAAVGTGTSRCAPIAGFLDRLSGDVAVFGGVANTSVDDKCTSYFGVGDRSV